MSVVIVMLVCLPFATAVVSWLAPVKFSQYLTITVGVITFVLALALLPRATHSTMSVGSLLQADALSVVFLLAVTFLYATTSLFAKGYLSLGDGASGARYGKRFYAGFNLFCWSLVVAPLVNGLALLWVAIEITTVISALLVAIDDTDGAAEAAWKYVLLASLGLGIALFATIMMYYAGTSVFGASYSLTYPTLLAGAVHFHPDVVRFSFVLAVLGYGTKMGLFPVHTWLPDAHSEAPTPVSALLSGALLAMSFYAILRFFQIAVRTLGPGFPRDVLLIFGVATLLLAALYLLSQRDMKRLLAYSSVEHMGIMAIGMSFGATIAVVGVLLQVLAHAAAKGTAFFGVGSVVRKFGTKEMARIRGGVGTLPWSGPMLVMAVLALSAMPPFGIFRSEFDIVYGGLTEPRDVAVAIFVVLVVLSFFGLSWFTTETMLSENPSDRAPGVDGAVIVTKGEVSNWIVVAMATGIVALLILGVHPPSQLTQLLDRAANELGSP
ncbi:MAG: proton-conducting transporter membrane subunit [Actinomycetota bacterium]|nr:proton-conducting transporter membrane subunit [Actinomycetota bacterium]NNN09413.1 NADH dehydrogenase FAD-containing subunit [Acidimicrobiaceae bacterium]